MNCKRCGTLITNEDLFCKGCGVSVETLKRESETASSIPAVSEPMQSAMPTFEQPVQNAMPAFQQPVQSTQTFQQPVQNAMPTFQQPVQSTQTFEQPVQNAIPTFQQPVQITPTFEQPVQNAMPTFQQPVQSTPTFEQPVQNAMPTQMYTTATNTNEPKNNIIKNPLIIGIVAIIVLALAVFVGMTLIPKNEIQAVAIDTVKLNFEGFDLNLPEDYTYKIVGSELRIGDEEDTWGVSLKILDGKYSTIFKNKGLFKGELEKIGYTSSHAAVKNYGKIEWITTEASKAGTSGIVAYAKASSTKVIFIAVLSSVEDYDYEVLKKMSKILETIVYVGETNNSENGFDLDAITNTIKE